MRFLKVLLSFVYLVLEQVLILPLKMIVFRLLLTMVVLLMMVVVVGTQVVVLLMVLLKQIAITTFLHWVGG